LAEVLLLQKKSIEARNLEERQRIKDEEANMKEKTQKKIMEDKKKGMLDNLNFMECNYQLKQ
jgi:hypothetical protein